MTLALRANLAVAAALLLPCSAVAGTFRVQSVTLDASGTPNPDWVYIQTASSAKYIGQVNMNDNNWNIEADLWENYRNQWHHGPGNNGQGVSPHMIITCPLSWCGGFTEIPECTPQEGSYRYRGKGTSYIYHQFNPEIDALETSNRYTACFPGPGDPPGPVEPPDPDADGGTPIVISLGTGAFRFTDLTQSVHFDIDAMGAPEVLSWTDPAGDEAFLVLDRNANGFVDDGTELFGSVTARPPSEEPNGFKALTVLDQPEAGGNSDGWISVEDAVWEDLQLWHDANQNGFSEVEEQDRRGEWLPTGRRGRAVSSGRALVSSAELTGHTSKPPASRTAAPYQSRGSRVPYRGGAQRTPAC